MKLPRSAPAIYGIELLFAWTGTLVGAVLPQIIHEFNLTQAQAGLIGTVQSLTSLPAVFLAGFVSEWLGPSRVLLAGAIMLALSPSLIIGAPSFIPLLAGVGLVGAALGVVDPMTNAEMARISGDARGRLLSLLHASYGVGAALTPILAAALMGLGTGWRGSMAAGMALSLGMGIWFARRTWRGSGQLHAPKASAKARGIKTQSLLKDPGVWALASALVLYAGAYRNLAFWIVTFFRQEIGASTGAAAGAMFLLFVTITLGRLFAFRFGDYVERTRLVLVYSVGGALSLFVLPIAHGLGLAWASVALFGLATAGIFPIITAFGVEEYPDKAGTLTGIIYGAASMGGILMPWLTGIVAEHWDLRRGMAVNAWAMAAAALCFAYLATRRIIKRG